MMNSIKGSKLTPVAQNKSVEASNILSQGVTAIQSKICCSMKKKPDHPTIIINPTGKNIRS